MAALREGADILKIDAFTHVRPQAYVERAQALLGDSYQGGTYGRPELWDIDARVRHVDEAQKWPRHPGSSSFLILC
jgi:hypothetical protein